jgi:peptidylprolyl isomerase
MNCIRHKLIYRTGLILIAAAMLAGCLGVGTKSYQSQKEQIAKRLGIDLKALVVHSSGLEWVVRKEGTGERPKKRDRISAHYTGYLLENGKKFDSSHNRGKPFFTPIGVGRVIKGWDIAFQDMRVGEKRVLFIPPELGYGMRGAGRDIPPGASLVFDVELIRIN